MLVVSPIITCLDISLAILQYKIKYGKVEVFYRAVKLTNILHALAISHCKAGIDFKTSELSY